MSANTYGPYLINGEEKTLARLTTERFQKFIKVFSRLPVKELWEGYTAFMAAMTPPEGTEPGEHEMVIPSEVVSNFGNAIMTMADSIEDDNILARLQSIALGISIEESENMDYDVGLNAANDFFTANPNLLPNLIRGLTGLIIPTKRDTKEATAPPQKKNSKTVSEPSQQKQDGSADDQKPQK